MEKENVLEIEFQKVWDKWAWQVIKCKLEMKDNEFFIEANTKLMLKVGYRIDEYIICTEANYKGVGEYKLITNEEKECIENFVNLVNQKYGIPKRFKPENCEEYYFILSDGYVISKLNYMTTEDKSRYDLGNCFETEEEAEKVKEELNKFWAKVREGEIGGEK
ncbi:hypothetical protein [Fusobacterium polymorphum]|uniref:hypothetical protein n=1 Tax=Fusobacterium nucleatum subsp. polymorphum TaxID=76857 RepID=UPI003009DAF3